MGAEVRPTEADLDEVRGGELALPKRESSSEEARLLEEGMLGSVAEGVMPPVAAASLAGSRGASKALGAGGRMDLDSLSASRIAELCAVDGASWGPMRAG